MRKATGKATDRRISGNGRATLGNHFLYLYVICVVTVLLGCDGGNERQASEAVVSGDSLIDNVLIASRHGREAPSDIKQTVERVMTLAAEEPERALAAIDSFRTAGLPDYEAEWLRAKVYSTSPEAARLDSAIVIAERLMEQPVAKENREYREDVLETLVNACRLRHDDERVLRWTAELVALCRERGEATEALRNEAESGLCLTHVGRLQEGLAKIDSVMAVFDSVRRFNELDAWLIAAKRKITVLKENNAQTDIIPIANLIIDRLTDYEQHPEVFRDGSYREPSDEDRQGYIDFYRAQTYGYMAEAYARSGESQKARECLEIFEQSAYGQTLDGRKMISPTWTLLGETEKMEAMYKDLTEARFRDYEQRMEIERQKAEATHSQQVSLGLGLLVMLLMAVIGILIYYQRVVRRKNSVLVREIAEAIEYKDKYWLLREETEKEKTQEEEMSVSQEATTDLTSLTDTQLFQFFRNNIMRDELFLDPSFDRRQLMDTYHISKDRIGSAFKKGSEYESLIDFLNDCRLDHSAKLLSSRPDMTIGEVAAASGFASLNTFGRNFKRKFTLTPSQYKEQRTQIP